MEDHQKFYEELANSLANDVKVEFRKIWFRARPDYGTAQTTTICEHADGTFHMHLIWGGSFPSIDFWELSVENGNKWDEVTFVLSDDGEFTVDFKYDLTEEEIADFDYQRKWIRKHVGDVEVSFPPPPGD